MKARIVRGLLAFLLVGLFAVPADAQRRRVERRPAVEVRVRVPTVRIELPRVRVIAEDRWYYGSGKRAHVSLRRLRQVSPRAFWRAMRDHRELHREMARMYPREARLRHEQWHRHTGWSHREFADVQRH